MARTICVDASVVAKWAFDEPLRAEALAIRSAYSMGAVRLVAPEHFSVEHVSVVKHNLEAGRIDQQGARRALALLFSLDVVLTSVGGLAERTLEVAVALRDSAWDAAYIAVAEAEGCDFWTADKVLARRAKPHFPFVKLLGEDTLEQETTP